MTKTAHDLAREIIKSVLGSQYDREGGDTYIDDVSQAIQQFMDEQTANQNQWQPIETAPRLQTVLARGMCETYVGYKVDNKKFYVCTNGDADCFRDGNGRAICKQPTHWMPLPTPPATKAEG